MNRVINIGNNMSYNNPPKPSEAEISEPSQRVRPVVWQSNEGLFNLAGVFDQNNTIVPVTNMAHRAGMNIGVSAKVSVNTLIIRTESGGMIALGEGFCLDEKGKLHRLPVEQAPDVLGYAQPKVPHIVVGQPWEPIEGMGKTDGPVKQVYIDYKSSPTAGFPVTSVVPLIPFKEMHTQIMDLSAKLQATS